MDMYGSSGTAKAARKLLARKHTGILTVLTPTHCVAHVSIAPAGASIAGCNIWHKVEFGFLLVATALSRMVAVLSLVVLCAVQLHLASEPTAAIGVGYGVEGDTCTANKRQERTRLA
jgi:hypothetical protein